MDDAIAETAINAEVRVERWNWSTGQWQDDRLPVPDPPPPPVRLHPDQCATEVQLHVHWDKGDALAEEMRKAGFLALSARPGVLVGVRDEHEQEAAIAWAHEQHPEAAVTTNHMSWLRHWQWRESLFGNYASGDPGSPLQLRSPVRSDGDDRTFEIDYLPARPD